MARTTERGYGTEHQKVRDALLRTLRPGTPCPRCRWPMFPWQPLDAGHHPARPASLGHRAERLEHRRCNRAAGARVRNARARAAARRDPLPEW